MMSEEWESDSRGKMFYQETTKCDVTLCKNSQICKLYVVLAKINRVSTVQSIFMIILTTEMYNTNNANK